MIHVFGNCPLCTLMICASTDEEWRETYGKHMSTHVVAAAEKILAVKK